MTLADAPDVKVPFAEDEQQEFDRFMSLYTGASKRKNWLTSLWNPVVILWTHWRHEREVKRAVAKLWELDDRILEDIGIDHRYQIEEVVRTQKRFSAQAKQGYRA